MVFSSSIFVFAFLPLTLLFYFIAEKSGSIKAKNHVLLFASIIFYAWGGIQDLILIIILIVINYFISVMIDKSESRKVFLVTGIIVNIGSLLFFKYFTFIVQNSSLLFTSVTSDTSKTGIPQIPLPIGISFFVFKIVSYLIDVYRGQTSVQKKLTYMAMYIMMFPHLIAGPIVRYCDIRDKFETRSTTLENFEYGIKRFISGFFKKVVIASSMGVVVDSIFSRIGQINTMYAWIGAICYTIQIYYDFSGYSDMAIGLGAMFGFRFKENFNFPYISTSIQDFWRRWHISLSSWFRDYVYIPLGGNRKGSIRTYINLIIVFFLTGLWHGAAWQFVVWGLYHGFFLVIERGGFGKLINKAPVFLTRIYAMIVVVIGWVFFRSDTLGDALSYLKCMFAFDFSNMVNLEILTNMTNVFFISLILAVYLAAPRAYMKKIIEKINLGVLNKVFYSIVWICSVLYMIGLTYNPFIYFKF